MANLLEWASKAAAAALRLETLEFGPWQGSMRKVQRDEVPHDHLADGNDFVYVPSNGDFRRRLGQTLKFDTLSSGHELLGLLPAKWGSAGTGKGARARKMEEFKSESISDGVPTIATLLTTETVASGLDDGMFSQFWLRDQVGGLNYTLGQEYGTSTYPVPGTEATLKIVPLWYDSGSGGVTRGVTEFLRRFFFCGARGFERVGNWLYFPSLLGTPSRWRGRFAAAIAAIASPFTLRPASTASRGLLGNNWSGQDAGANLHTYIDETVADDADYIHAQTQDTCRINLGSHAAPTAGAVHVLRIRRGAVLLGGAAPLTFGYTLQQGAAGAIIKTATGQTITTTPTTYEVTLSAAEIALITDYTDLDLLFVNEDTFTSWDTRVYWAELDIGNVGLSGTPDANRLIPSGPLPPIHAGSLARGPGILVTALRPDGTAAAGTWTEVGPGTTLNEAVDEVTADDTDYMTCATNGTADLTLPTPATIPVAGDLVVVRFRARAIGIVTPSTITLAVGLNIGATAYADAILVFGGNTQWTDYSITLTDAQIAAVTRDDATWATIQIRATAANLNGVEAVAISQVYVDITPADAIAEGGWMGKHRFYYSVAYRFEDDSVWMPCDPRAPNSFQSNGFNLFTVDAGSPETHYRSILWQNLPIGPYGVKGRLLLRTPKIDSTTEDNLQLNPHDLRIVTEIKDNTTTSYEDFYADDLAPVLDAQGLFIHFNHLMPPRARYIAAGDMRIAHGYGGLNPCAIEIAPVGVAADYDLNANDETDALWAEAKASYLRVIIDDSAADKLELLKCTDGTTITTPVTFDFDTYTTLQKLIDAVNVTAFAVDGIQWRAQMCPGANPNLDPESVLTPTLRNIASCVVSGQTITKAAGGLSKVAVGDRIVRSGVKTDGYVTRIDSDTQLTFTGTVAAGTVTLGFAKDSGDAPQRLAATTLEGLGYQRVIGGCLPGFLYFSNDYLDQFPIDKSSTWLTSAGPGAARSAANNFHGNFSGKHTPPGNVGNVMGVYAVDNGFVVPHRKKRCAIRNTRDSGTGVDDDYRIFVAEESSGCVAWGSVWQGNRCGGYASPEGIVAADLFHDLLLSEPIFRASPIQGDFDYEIPASDSASAADNDLAYLYARVLGKELIVNYRNAAGSHPDRQVKYDFSLGRGSGLDQLKRPDGKLWGWSLELVRSFSVMAEGTRELASAGRHRYGWNEQNQGSTGDGRVDEFDTAETDNGTAISAAANFPYIKDPDGRQISLQECTVEHLSPSGSAGTLVIHRSYSDATHSLTMTAGTSSTVPTREQKHFPQAARVGSAAYYLAYLQASGSARELRKLFLRLKRLPAYK